MPLAILPPIIMCTSTCTLQTPLSRLFRLPHTKTTISHSNIHENWLHPLCPPMLHPSWVSFCPPPTIWFAFMTISPLPAGLVYSTHPISPLWYDSIKTTSLHLSTFKSIPAPPPLRWQPSPPRATTSKQNPDQKKWSAATTTLAPQLQINHIPCLDACSTSTLSCKF